MRILIRATNWVGDAIMALPAIRAVREKYPNAAIAILARPYVLDIYRDQEVADELIAYDWTGTHKGFGGRAKLIEELRARRFDVALLLQNAFDAAWLAWRAGIPERIGYARDGRSWLLTKALPVPKAEEIPAHEKFYYLELLRRAGWMEKVPEIEWISLAVSQEKRNRAENSLTAAGSQGGRTRIAVGAGASYGSAKCWPPERFAEALNRVTSERDCDVVLFGTAGESAVSNAIIAGLQKSPIDMTGKTAIADLPALLSRCSLFIGNDSGAMHVAGAVGLPIVAIFGPTDPSGTVPVTPRCTVVQQKPYCSPCFLRRCPTDHRCMKGVTPQMVEAATLAAFEACLLPDGRNLRAGVFLDRDGTILDEVGYLNHVSRYRMLPGAAGAIARLNAAGLPVFVVSNQSGVARGYFPESVVTEVNKLMESDLETAGAKLAAVYYCPHGSADKCECRKPKLGMVQRAAKEFGIDPARSFFVGDRRSDIELGHAAGGKSILVRTGYGEGELAWHVDGWSRTPDFVASDLSGAVEWILGGGK